MNNSSKLRKIILEEMSMSQPTRPYRRPRKLGLMDYLGESSVRNLLELDDSSVISTGVSLSSVLEATEDQIMARAGEIWQNKGAPKNQSPDQMRDDYLSAKDALEREERDSAQTDPPDTQDSTPDQDLNPEPPAGSDGEPPAEPDPIVDTGGEETSDNLPPDGGSDAGQDTDGDEVADVATDPDTGSYGADSDGLPGDPPAQTPTASGDDQDEDTMNAAVVDYIDNVSSGSPEPVSESRSSLVKMLYSN